MVAVEFGSPDGGLTAKPGTASQVTKAAGRRNMLLLSAGMQFHLLQEIVSVCLTRSNVSQTKAANADLEK